MIFCPACMATRRNVLAAGAALAASIGSPVRAATSGAPVVDFHTHMLNPALISDELRAAFGARLDALLQPEVQIARMKSLGIDRHVVSQAGAIQGVTWGDAAKDLEIHRRTNDRILDHWVSHDPARFMGAFGVPTQDLKLALPEVERMAGKPGMRMLQVSSHTSDKVYYGDPSLDPLMRALEHFGIVLFIHPHLQMRDGPLAEYGLFNSVGQGIEEAKVMSNIIMQGVFDKFPRLKILVGHGGGFLPHYGGRLDRNIANIPGSGRNLTQPPSAYLKRFYYDSCVYSADVLSRLSMAVGPDRIVLGGDYPLGLPDPLAEIRAAKGLDQADLTAILSGNGARLLSPV